MTHSEYANALRRIADFVETHSALPVPATSQIDVFPQGKTGLAAYGRALGKCDKNFNACYAQVIKDFGGIVLIASEDRDAVCERVVVGKRVVPERITPAVLVPEHVEEIVEWRCPDSLLGGI